MSHQKRGSRQWRLKEKEGGSQQTGGQDTRQELKGDVGGGGYDDMALRFSRCQSRRRAVFGAKEVKLLTNIQVRQTNLPCLTAGKRLRAVERRRRPPSLAHFHQHALHKSILGHTYTTPACLWPLFFFFFYISSTTPTKKIVWLGCDPQSNGGFVIKLNLSKHHHKPGTTSSSSRKRNTTASSKTASPSSICFANKLVKSRLMQNTGTHTACSFTLCLANQFFFMLTSLESC